jgi:hypothetical protein
MTIEKTKTMRNNSEGINRILGRGAIALILATIASSKNAMAEDAQYGLNAEAASQVR